MINNYLDTFSKSNLKIILSVLCFSSSVAFAATCTKPVYLTFDTGNMAVAEYVANTLSNHQVKATFFLANEKTKRGDFSLDDSWASFWKSLKKEGHSFGNHTYHHTYFINNLDNDKVMVRPQFGPNAGKKVIVDQPNLCSELQLVNDRLDPIWRAPGGKVSPQYIEMGHICGYTHVGWASAGFLGDELSSEKFSNKHLLDKALREIRSGDVLMAHLGIWSRHDAWAPAVLEPLIVGLKEKGFCFETINQTKRNSQFSRIIQ
jgi:peptidoglycan/xylan/chitin deacetylase (PgdA/CDA1 family)